MEDVGCEIHVETLTKERVPQKRESGVSRKMQGQAGGNCSTRREI